MSTDEHSGGWKAGGGVGKRYAVVDIGYSGEARCGGGRLGRQETVFLLLGYPNCSNSLLQPRHAGGGCGDD